MIAAFAVLLLFILLFIRSAPPATADAIQILFLGYTNPPGNSSRFAQFSVSNQAPYTIRWRGGGAEIEGHPGYQAQVVNRNLPTYTSYYGRVIRTNQPGGTEPILKPGESLRLAIGEPTPEPDQAALRWRYSMFFCRYTLPQRYYDRAWRNNWPLKVGPIVLVDGQKLLDPSNNVTVSSPWLEK